MNLENLLIGNYAEAFYAEDGESIYKTLDALRIYWNLDWTKTCKLAASLI